MKFRALKTLSREDSRKHELPQVDVRRDVKVEEELFVDSSERVTL